MLLSRPLLFPGERFDLEDFHSLLSGVRADSNYYTKRLLSDKNYIIKGFTIPQSYIGYSGTQINMNIASSTLINSENTGDYSWWTASDTDTTQPITIGTNGLESGRNYVELQLYAQNGTPLQRAFWDPTANSGAGTEFTQEVDTITELRISVSVNQTGWAPSIDNKIPLYIVDMVGTTVTGIQDKRNLFFRLGTPDDINSDFNWVNQSEPTTVLTFTTPSLTPFKSGEQVTFTGGSKATIVVGGTDNIQVYDFTNPNFIPGSTVTGDTSGSAQLATYYENQTGADKNIENYKDMFDALMTEIKRVKGTQFWHEAGNVLSLPMLMNYVNAMLVPVSDGAKWHWSGSALSITDNMVSGQSTANPIGAVRIPGSASDLILTRQDGTGGSAVLALADQDVLFVKLPTVGTSRTYSESGTLDENYQVVTRNNFIPSTTNLIIAYREGDVVVFPSGGELKPSEDLEIGDETSIELLAFIGAEDETDTTPPYTTLPDANLSNQFNGNDSLTQAISVNAGNINDIASTLLRPYQEPLRVVVGTPVDDNEIQGPITSGTNITIPLDRRDSNKQKRFVVDSGSLFVFLNGQELMYGEDYTEVGTVGALSYTFQILQDLIVGDTLDIRIVTPQYFGLIGEPQPWFINYIIGQNGDNIPVGNLYNRTTEKLQVWRNGLCMLRSNVVGDAIDQYTEATNNAINLTQTANSSEIFTFVNHEEPVPVVSLISGLPLSTNVITVPTYVMGDGSLRVFRNGVLMTTEPTASVDIVYSETSTSSITISDPTVAGDVFKIFISGSAPTWRHTVIGNVGTLITIPMGDTYTMGDKKLMVFRNGVLLYNSLALGDAIDRYTETSSATITLGVATTATDLIELLYV